MADLETIADPDGEKTEADNNTHALTGRITNGTAAKVDADKNSCCSNQVLIRNGDSVPFSSSHECSVERCPGSAVNKLKSQASCTSGSDSGVNFIRGDSDSGRVEVENITKGKMVKSEAEDESDSHVPDLRDPKKMLRMKHTHHYQDMRQKFTSLLVAPPLEKPNRRRSTSDLGMEAALLSSLSK